MRTDANLMLDCKKSGLSSITIVITKHSSRFTFQGGTHGIVQCYQLMSIRVNEIISVKIELFFVYFFLSGITSDTFPTEKNFKKLDVLQKKNRRAELNILLLTN